MYLTAETKKKMFKEHGGSEKNTGSSEAQIAMFTHRINFLTKHMQENPKDLSTKRSLVNLVGKRKSLIEYLKKKDIAKYRALIKKLDIRR
jgi:small subunit ribosomal protein S15